MIRGTGIEGIAGIDPGTNTRVTVQPLIRVSVLGEVAPSLAGAIALTGISLVVLIWNERRSWTTSAGRGALRVWEVAHPSPEDRQRALYEAITGKPYKPTTQGKNERFHQTLFRYLDKQPLADSLAELQTQVDAFDDIYNTERPHQGLPGRVTPLTAWQATPKTDAPRPKPHLTWLDRPVEARPRHPRTPPPVDLPADTLVRKVSSAGVVRVDKVFYKLDVDHAFKQVLVVTDDSKITVTDFDGEILGELTRPAPGVTYVGNGRPPGTRPKNPRVSPKS